ncbi:MAG: GNAT family N-acetyltransferase [Oscillospiraceae bacterium]|nr:GNAT family N-acetyltransferase [Oscillospiraceae bacterium]
MLIRNAEVRDIPGMIELLKQVGEVHHVIRPDIFRSGALKYNETDLEAILADPTRPIFVAVEGGFVAGYCFCVHKLSQGDSVLMDSRELYIDDLCVDEGCRGQGVAKALYAHTLEYAKKSGCDAITLNVWNGNDTALRFYEKAGFTPRKTIMEVKLC